MAVMTVSKPIIETAFERMGMKEKLEELWNMIDEIELDGELDLAWEECQRGECSDLEETVERIRMEINEG